MNKKITISELSQLLSTNVSLINKKGWEDFLRIFFAQISEGLQTEGNVKIKGLGTFKVVTVDARKSKDVNTGANTIIPAHNKISFTPDSTLAETLNKPYAHFESTYILAPEGDVDAPENDDEEESVTLEAETETIQEQKPVVEDKKAEIKEDSENIDVKTQIVETAIESQIIKSQTAESQATESQIAESQATESQIVNQEQISQEPVSNSEDLAKEVNATETNIDKKQDVDTEQEAESNVDNTETDNDQATETTPISEPSATEDAAKESEEDNASEEPEEKEEEDPTADDDDNIDTNPKEIAAYASTYKRHDLPQENSDNDNDKSNKKLGIAIVLFLCILAVAGIVAWIYKPDFIKDYIDKFFNKPQTEVRASKDSTNDNSKVVIVENEQTEANADNNANSLDDTASEATSEKTDEAKDNESKANEVKAEEVATPKTNISTKFKDDFVAYMKTKHPEMDITDKGEPVEEIITSGKRLTLVSQKHYGAKDFWIYVYLYNKDVIKNPNNIKTGTKIKVPKLDTKTFVNPNLEHSILTAQEIRHEFVKY